jgi:hypothetical protein
MSKPAWPNTQGCLLTPAFSFQVDVVGDLSPRTCLADVAEDVAFLRRLLG